MRASLDLAEAGLKVYLCDRSPSIGGALVQMDKWFPDNHCGLCQMLPVFNRDASSQYCLRRGLMHPLIEQLPLTEVEEVQGEAGDFKVTVKRQPRGVDPDRCIGCGLCTGMCPVEVADDFERGLGTRKAIYLRHPLLPSNLYSIDWTNCTRCGACVERCPTDAIDLSQQEEIRELEVGAIVLSTGFEEFDPRPLTQYGHGRYPNVITNIELERMLSPSGPVGGRLLRPSDGGKPESVAFIQCAGSRDMDRNYCSSTCCMYALKEAVLIKQADPEVNVRIFYMDMRAFGKGYHGYYLEAEGKWGVNFTRCRVPVVKQDFRTNDLLITAPSEDGALNVCRFDMVVLSTGQAPSPRFQDLCQRLGLKTNKWGFCRTDAFSPVETSGEGVYVCGPAAGPKDIADTLCEAGACAAEVTRLLAPSRSQLVPMGSHPLEESSEDDEPRTAVFLCRCGEEISAAVDMDGMARFARTLPDVTLVRDVRYLCQRDGLEGMKKVIRESAANRVVVAACSYFLNGKLSEVVHEAGLDPASFHVVNLREEVAWVHDERVAATQKANDLIAMAVERLRLQESAPLVSTDVVPAALVIGGGLAGLTAALAVAGQGYETHLVEKLPHLGGNLRDVYATLERNDPQALLGSLTARVEASPLIHLCMETEVVQVEGYAGNYEVALRGAEGATSIVQVGAVVVATGGQESRPGEYLYGESENVITQRELGGKLAQNELNAKALKSVVMIQCVGSRDEDRPYCSRICCSQALKNALALKERNPDTEVIVLYRDLMSYGFREEFYTRAREAGVLFIRYELERKPRVSSEDGRLKVEVLEPELGRGLVIEPDLLVLSPAIVPNKPVEIAEMLDVELDDDGFFQEAEAKFRPVETFRDSVFVCGLAHSPRDIGETITQAQAAAQRAVTLLARQRLQSGRVVAEVNARRCTGCEVCVGICPYGARVKDEEQGVVVVREALCRGCGACATACPNGAAQLRGFSERQMFAMMDMV